MSFIINFPENMITILKASLSGTSGIMQNVCVLARARARVFMDMILFWVRLPLKFNLSTLPYTNQRKGCQYIMNMLDLSVVRYR